MSVPSTITKTKDDLINQAHEARRTRDLARRREHAATTIQAFLKSSYYRRKLKESTLKEFESYVCDLNAQQSHDILITIRKLLFVCSPRKDRAKLDNLLEFILGTIEQDVDLTSKGKNLRIMQCPGQAVDYPANDQIRQDTTECNLVKSTKGDLFLMWSLIKERLLNLCLDFLQDTSSALDSQHIDLYLNLIQLFMLDCRPNFVAQSPNNLPGTGVKVAIKDRISLGVIVKRVCFLHSTANIIKDKLDRFRSDLRKSILCNYTKILLTLIDYLSRGKVINIDDIPEGSRKMIVELLILMLTLPGFIYHIETQAPELKNALDEHEIVSLTSSLLINSLDFQTLSSTSSVYMIANLIHLASITEKPFIGDKIKFVSLITKLMEYCQKNMVLKCNKTRSGSNQAAKIKSSNRKNNETVDVSFNPIIGWLSREQATQVDINVIKSQLSHLWECNFLKLLFQDLIEANQSNQCEENSMNGVEVKALRAGTCTQPSGKKSDNKSSSDHEAPLTVICRAVGRAASVVGKTLNSSYAKLDPSYSNQYNGSRLLKPATNRIAHVCLMLQTALDTLTTLKHDILAGLCLHDFVIRNLWIFIKSLSPDLGVKAFIEHLALFTKINATELQILILFCECGSHLMSVLDDTELYEKQRPFTISELNSISQFLNQFVFRLIVQHLVNLTHQEKDPILRTAHKFLTDLYRRDCQRNFTPKNHWLIKDIKISIFLKDLESGKVAAKSIMALLPHAIPHKERVMIFRKLVSKDKALHRTGPSTLITIHRSRLVEDGYQQLARLPLHALKGLIRVKFINDYGLDEAGLDQDGVFKEFLEDTIKKVFDPALNLFCSTSEQRLYPSPTSRLHEDHLSLFNFVGKMLGKAIYEGIVVDVPFASFFLSRVLGQPHNALYSAIDELPSLDPELYKSLTYIKHYDGDVSELDLTFSIDQDFMGKIETYELEPGGKSIPVTRESRVRYIHSVANFRMKTQIEKQTEAFVSGFKSIINLDWLSMFSASEFQRLISGDDTPIDLTDLKKHTKYFGGFHSNHRVVCWLWDTLEKDFSAEEHRLFLKFVTSCSKPPLLGFGNLEPPFTIRCVEVSDDQDSGDTVGSVLRGFFAIRRSDPVDRLPTSSTCFNLLKLPNYQRRSTLRDKLRYAIRSNPGFELS